MTDDEDEVVDADTDLHRRRDVVVAELDVLRARMSQRDPAGAEQRVALLRSELGSPGSLDEVEEGFGLSEFERAVLLLACGPELVGDVGLELMEHTGQSRISFGAALARLPGAHWDALTPQGPLRHWEMLRPTDPDALLASPLVADERLVHHLVGAGHLDERLIQLSQPVEAPSWLPPTLVALAAEVVSRWSANGPVVLRGAQPGNTRAVAASACATVGLAPRLLGAGDLPSGAADLALLIRRMVRETVLGRVAWLIDLDDGEGSVASLGRVLTTCDAPVALLSSGGPGSHPLPRLELPRLDVPRLGVGERRTALASALRRAGTEAPADELDAVAGAFDLPVGDHEVVAHEVAEGRSLWSACRRRPRGDGWPGPGPGPPRHVGRPGAPGSPARAAACSRISGATPVDGARHLGVRAPAEPGPGHRGALHGGEPAPARRWPPR